MQTNKKNLDFVTPAMEKIMVGLTEKVDVITNGDTHEVLAKIDTGATNSSIDITLAGTMSLGPVIATKYIKNAHGKKLRPVIKIHIKVAGKELIAEFTLADRQHMKFPMLIGQNVLKQGFLIDPGYERVEE